ncbi:CoA transferase [Vibrio sp. S4M6]|uniref:CoA transferase n=1 Tax=Vibrio sinus TaxID=2946865 RepID=UPI002029EBB7|nr:CoA transferase [Vibrio sinus]MCL9782212.1 CoA transferase [Vibrio sinus]
MKQVKQIVDMFSDDLGIQSPYEQIKWVEGSPIVSTQLPAGDLLSALNGLLGHSVREFGRYRGLDDQGVEVDERNAAFDTLGVFLEHRYGQPISNLEANSPWCDFYETADDQLVFFANEFLHLRDDSAKFFNCAHNSDAIRKAIGKYTSEQIEQFSTEHGQCGYKVRSYQEWQNTPMYDAISQRKLLDIREQSTGSKTYPTAKYRPLEGIKVLDLTHVVAGATAGRVLAENGADVISVRHPHFPQLLSMQVLNGWGKRHIFLDYKTEFGLKKLKSLIAQADVLIFGYHHDALSSVGLSKQALRMLNPNLIYAEINAFGPDGPWKFNRGWEQNGQCVAGVADVWHKECGERKVFPYLVNDVGTGLMCALNVVQSLLKQVGAQAGFVESYASLAKTSSILMGAYDSTTQVQEAKPISQEDYFNYVFEQDSTLGPITRIRPAYRLEKTPTQANRGLTIQGYHDPNIEFEPVIGYQDIEEKPLQNLDNYSGLELGKFGISAQYVPGVKIY